MLTFTWLLSDTPPDGAEAVRDRWDALVDGLFARSAAA
jgi:hypothetical protein